jgi:hypothetical protein
VGPAALQRRENVCLSLGLSAITTDILLTSIGISELT